VILPDVNVLIYAFRSDAPEHAVSKAFLESEIASERPFAVSRLALAALLRVTTNKRSQRSPSTLSECFEFCRRLVDQPNCQIVEPGEAHWPIFERLCLDTGTIGPRVTDAWYAALAIERGCEWITFDRDYARFPGLRWRTPARS